MRTPFSLLAAVGIAGCLLVALSACSRPHPTPIGTLYAVAPTNAPEAGAYLALDREVWVQGVAIQPVWWKTSRGDIRRGMVLQNTAVADTGMADEGGLVMVLSENGELAGPDGPHIPAKGDELLIRGTVAQSGAQLVLDDAVMQKLIRRGCDLDQLRPPFEVVPPADIPGAKAYWAQHAGRRGILPQGSLVQGVFQDEAGGFSGISLIRPDAPVTTNPNPYARRVFRDWHPLDDNPGELFDNGNGYRMLLGATGLKAAQTNPMAMLPAVRTFSVLAAPVTGAVLALEGGYAIHPEQPPHFEPGVDPALNHPFRPEDRAGKLSVVSYNFENLYDFRDDPFDLRDYEEGALTNTPLILRNYVPPNEAAYRNRLRDLAQQILEDLHSPDILIVQEIEDQDIGAIREGQLVAGAINHADGELDTLQELILELARLGGPVYRTLCDRSGADDRGIVCAFLYRPDRMQPANPALDYTALARNDTSGILMRYHPQSGNPAALNEWTPTLGVVFERPPQIACFQTAAPQAAGAAPRLFLIANHFKSRPDDFIEQRREQARFNAQLVRGLLAGDPEARVIVAGDLNVYPRPDEPIPETPTDQLGALYEAGLASAFDILLAARPEAAYSYVYDGQAQTLDHIFMTPALRRQLAGVWIPHINSDFKHVQGTRARGVSDHDPVVTTFTWP